jgi:ABC-type sugar transport system permease subunit
LLASHWPANLPPARLSVATTDDVLAYQVAFRHADFNAAAAISVDLLVIGLLAAVVVVSRTGLFRADD